MTSDSKKNLGSISKMDWRYILAFALVLVVIYTWNSFYGHSPAPRYPLNYTVFMEQLNAGGIKSVSIKNLIVTGELEQETSMTLPGYQAPVKVRYFQTILPTFQGEQLLALLDDKEVIITIESGEQGIFLKMLIGALPWVLIIGVWIYFAKKTQQVQGGPGGLFQFGKSKAKLYDAKKVSITFKDVAGMENVKMELRETIEFLSDPSRFIKIGAKVPKGVLLIGPPGTGKTLIARATAGEAAVPFYNISGSEFIEMFVGVGASRVRDMFKKAKDSHPSIIFIDEIDAVGRTRGTGLGGGHDEREQTLNQLLSEMDGFDPHQEVIVIAATNRPDVLDPALLRPGRFDRHIVIDRPGWKERKAILEIHVRDKVLAADMDFEVLAKGTPGMTGADLENLANEAALVALRKGKEKVDMSDFQEAEDIILMGSVREEPISEKERQITAYHEAGHALLSWELPGADPIYKVSIIPRGMAMGVTQLLPQEDRHYYPRTYLMNKLSILLAGRVSEKIVFDDISSGAQNDLKEATLLAEKMVAQWGMSDKVGPINLGRAEEHPFLGMQLSMPKRYSEEMGWLMDQEIQKMIITAEAAATDILAGRRNILDSIADALLKEEVIERADIERIIKDQKDKQA
jgi:cell division protease FtsH